MEKLTRNRTLLLTFLSAFILLGQVMGYAGTPVIDLDEIAAGAVDYVMGESPHDYLSYGAAKQAYESTDSEVLVSGPAGTGKSRAILEKIHRLMLDYPGARALIVRKTRASLSESTLVTFEEHVLGEDHPLLMGKSGKTLERTNRNNYQYPNGSRIVLGGMDKPRRIMSSEYDIIYVPEAIELTKEDWESLSTRKRNYVIPFQQLIGDTNPGPPTHWLKQRCDEGLSRIIYSNHTDNPRLFNHETGEWTPQGIDYLNNTLGRLTGVRLKWYKNGEWVAAEGMVYESYDESVHLIDRFKIPKDWRRFCSIDFGLRNAFVCQWWAVNHDGVMFRYREIYMTGRIVQDHADEILRLNAGVSADAWRNMDESARKIVLQNGEQIEAYVADHDAEDRETLKRYGIVTTAAKKEIKPGIDAVEARLRFVRNPKTNEFTEAPTIFFLRDSVVERDEALVEAKLPWCTEQEFYSYVWSPSQEGKKEKEIPVDKDNHGLDTTRYAVRYMDGGLNKSAGRQMKYKFNSPGGRRRR